MAKRPAVRLPGTGPAMAAEHETEVTLDQVLDRLGRSKDRCLETYDQCAELSERARRLRDALSDLSEELAQRHNVIGRLTSGAMAAMSESMDVVADTSEAMRAKSLGAAEEVESVHDEMHDDYRPLQQAAADAGLIAPSARIHNES